MAWILLITAGVFEIVWAISLKYTEGFTKLWPSVIFGITAWLSFMLLAQAIKFIPIGTAYAVWTGIGAVGVAIAGIIWFGESASPIRIFCILLIIGAIAGLKLSGSSNGVP